VAIELPEDVRARLVQLRRRVDRGGTEIRWSRPETMHLTLKFLGDVKAESIAEVTEACRGAAGGAGGAGASPVEVAVEGLALFPSPKRPRVVSGRVAAGDGLVALQAAVERGLAKAGFAAERRGYRPHVTVGRLKGTRDAAGLAASLAEVSGGEEIGSFTADEIVVFQSELRKGGAVHTPLARMELAGG